MPDAILNDTQDPNAPQMSPDNAGGAPVAAPAQQAPAPQANPQQMRQAAEAMTDVAAHSRLGRAVRSLMGSAVDYKVNPQTGQMEQVSVAEKPGQIFRHILAGAILGGALGNRGRGEGEQDSIAGGFTRGASGVMEKQEELADKRKAQAQQDYERGRQATKDQREAQQFQTEETLRMAQIAHYNALTAQENLNLQGTTFTQHSTAAAAGKTQLQPFLDAGLKAQYENMPESEMTKLFTTNPQAQNLLWEPTGTKISTGKDGKPTYELTYSAVDPKGQIPVTPELLKLFKSVDMDKYFPMDGIKPGQSISAEQMIALQHEYQKLANEKHDRETRGLDEQDKRSQIAFRNAEAAKAMQEVQKTKDETVRNKLYDQALEDLNKAGGDMTKLTPRARQVIGEHSTKLITDYNQAIKNAMDTGNEAEAKSLMEQRDSLLQLANSAMSATIRPGGADVVTKALDAIKNLSPDEQRNAINSSNALSPEQKQKALAAVSARTQPTEQLPDESYGGSSQAP